MQDIHHSFAPRNNMRISYSATGMRPILLLDDIFDKLDATRVERIRTLSPDSSGQIFITDTNRTHLDEIMIRTGGDYRMWSVEKSTFSPRQNHETYLSQTYSRNNRRLRRHAQVSI